MRKLDQFEKCLETISKATITFCYISPEVLFLIYIYRNRVVFIICEIFQS